MKKATLSTLFVMLLSLPTSLLFGQKIGDTKTETLVSHLRAQASWNGCTAPTDRQESIVNPAPGWAIESHQTITHSRSNGSIAVSVIARGLEYTRKQAWSEAYDELIDLAGKYQDDEAKAKLIQQRNAVLSNYSNVSANSNTIHAVVTARPHGDCLVNRMRGWCEISVTAKLVYVGTQDDLNLITENLANELLLVAKDDITKRDIKKRNKALKSRS